MTNIDDEVVGMKFDNASFEKNAATTMGTLGKLKAALNFSGSSKGLNEVQQTANRFSLRGMIDRFRGAETAVGNLQRTTNRFSPAHMVDAASTVGKSFTAASLIAIGAISQITTKAVLAGGQIVNKFAFAPILGGLKEYETNLNSIQTILANTGLEGQKGLDKVNTALGNLNDYSDKTIYNFSEMARSGW